jgi:O-antigen ligase
MKALPANKYILLFYKYSLPLLVIGIISRTFNITRYLYYTVPVLLIISIIFFLIAVPGKRKDFFYFLIIILFPVYCAFTTLWSLTPDISIQRALYLLLIYSGIFTSVIIYKHFASKKNSLEFLLPANIIIVILSLLSLISGMPGDSWTGGNSLGFKGFAGHQNTLAAAILFTLPGVAALGIEQSARSQSPGVFRLWSFILLLASNLLLLTISYSRAALLALAFGIIAYLIFTKSKKILSYLIIIFIAVIALYYIVPPVQNSLNSVLYKNSDRPMDRRTILWQPSLEAAKLGGLFGLGYGVSAPGIRTPLKTGSHYENGLYVREKGNSVLAIIEETGFVGLLLFLLPIMLLIKKFKIHPGEQVQKSKLKIVPDHYTIYIVHCTLLVVLIHAQFEAWWVGVGSISLPLFLIFLFTALFQENYKSKELI